MLTTWVISASTIRGSGGFLSIRTHCAFHTFAQVFVIAADFSAFTFSCTNASRFSLFVLLPWRKPKRQHSAFHSRLPQNESCPQTPDLFSSDPSYLFLLPAFPASCRAPCCPARPIQPSCRPSASWALSTRAFSRATPTARCCCRHPAGPRVRCVRTCRAFCIVSSVFCIVWAMCVHAYEWQMRFLPLSSSCPCVWLLLALHSGQTPRSAQSSFDVLELNAFFSDLAPSSAASPGYCSCACRPCVLWHTERTAHCPRPASARRHKSPTGRVGALVYLCADLLLCPFSLSRSPSLSRLFFFSAKGQHR